MDGVRGGADEQVLAVADHLVDDLAGEVDRGERRYAEVGAGELAARQRLVQVVGGLTVITGVLLTGIKGQPRLAVPAAPAAGPRPGR